MTDKELKKIIDNHLHWLKRDCDGWETMKADLHGANLREADLHGVNLRGADLHNADLNSADLRGADLNNANMHDAKNIYMFPLLAPTLGVLQGSREPEDILSSLRYQQMQKGFLVLEENADVIKQK